MVSFQLPLFSLIYKLYRYTSTQNLHPHHQKKKSYSNEICEICLNQWKVSITQFFQDISPGPTESELRFRLIHFWVAKNISKGSTILQETEVMKVTEYDRVWKCGKCAFFFYKSVGIQECFHCCGHYCQPNNQTLKGFVLPARFKDPIIKRMIQIKSKKLRKITNRRCDRT